MTGRKYDKYFINYERTREEMETGFTGNMLRFDDNVVKGSHFYWAVISPMVGMKMEMPFGKPGQYVWHAGHPPHIHKDAEILLFLGTNPEDPTELGAEVEMYMGKELERHVITRTTAIFIPPNFIHSPEKAVRTWRPWIFMEINQGPVHTEKRYWQVLPEEIVATMDKKLFPDEGY